MKGKKGIPVLITIASAAVIASIVRFFQYVTIIDFSTGFFKSGSGGERYLVYILLALSAAAVFGVSLYSEKKRKTAFTITSDRLGEKTTLLFGVIFLAAAILDLWDAAMVNPDIETPVYSIILGISFGATAFLLIKNSVPPSFTGYLQLVPALCLFIKTVLYFNTDLIIQNRSDSLIILLGYLFGTLFLSALARFFARIENKHSRLREVFLAGVTFLFSSVHVISKTLASLFGGTAVMGMEPVDKTTACLMFISLAFICTVCLTNGKAGDTADVRENEQNVKTEETEAPRGE